MNALVFTFLIVLKILVGNLNKIMNLIELLLDE
jgi:hypothetical protein